MKRIIALLLCVVLLLTGCSVNIQIIKSDEPDESDEPSAEQGAGEVTEFRQNENIYETEKNYWGLSDPELLRFMEDTVYTGLVKNLDSEKYFVENVSAIYISKEFIDEITYNSQSNVFFGYTLAELDSFFQGTKYIFTLGENGETIVREEQAITDTTYDDAIKNVAIGTGIVLFCVAVTVVTGGAGAPTAGTTIVNYIAASARSTIAVAGKGMLVSGLVAGIAKGYETQDFDQALKAAVSSGSEGFKWGAISGVIDSIPFGEEIYDLTKSVCNGISEYEAAKIQNESELPLDVIKQFNSYDEYLVYKSAGLKPGIVNGKLALVRDIDISYESELPTGETVTNLIRMEKGYAPIDPATNKAYQLYHVKQDTDGTLAVLTEEEYQANAAILSLFEKGSDNSDFWQSFAKGFKN